MKSIFTEKEYQIIYADSLRDGKKRPLYRNVSETQMSIARFYGGMNINGEPYKYFPETDELVSAYALKVLKGLRKAIGEKTAVGEPKQEQQSLI